MAAASEPLEDGRIRVGTHLPSDTHPLPRQGLTPEALQEMFRPTPEDSKKPLLGFETIYLRINDHPPDREQAETYAEYAMSQINAHRWDKCKKKYRLVAIEAASVGFASVALRLMVKEDEEGGAVEKLRTRLCYPRWGSTFRKRRLLGYDRLLADGTWEILLERSPLQACN